MGTKRLCRCGRIVSGICEKCSPTLTHDRTTKERGYGSDWQRLRALVLSEYPLCQRCEIEGKTKAARHVHHIVPIDVAPWLRLDRNNLLAVCVECHAELHEGMATPGVGSR